MFSDLQRYVEAAVVECTRQSATFFCFLRYLCLRTFYTIRVEFFRSAKKFTTEWCCTTKTRRSPKTRFAAEYCITYVHPGTIAEFDERVKKETTTSVDDHFTVFENEPLEKAPKFVQVLKEQSFNVETGKDRFAVNCLVELVNIDARFVADDFDVDFELQRFDKLGPAFKPVLKSRRRESGFFFVELNSRASETKVEARQFRRLVNFELGIDDQESSGQTTLLMLHETMKS